MRPCLRYFLVAIIKYPDHGSLGVEGCILGLFLGHKVYHDREDMATDNEGTMAGARI